MELLLELLDLDGDLHRLLKGQCVGDGHGVFR